MLRREGHPNGQKGDEWQILGKSGVLHEAKEVKKKAKGHNLCFWNRAIIPMQ
jgi:hypothetical protein